MLKKTSITRLMTLSQAPPRYPPASPSTPPATIAVPTETRAT